MEKQIKMMASAQLGLNSLEHLGRFEIEGWPRFVSILRACWDDLALKDLQEALPSLSFTLKPAKASSKKKTLALGLKRIELHELLLTKFKKDREDQQEKDYIYIHWHNFHVKGWPNGISLQRDNWTFPDLLAIYHCIDGISWEPVKKGEDRSVTYTDGTVELFPRKRAAVAAVSGHEANNFECSERTQISDAEASVEDQNNAIESDDESSSDEEVNDDITDAQIPERLRIERRKMYKRIKAIATEQLGPIPGKELEELDIEGWPRFVGTYNHTWDETALKYLKDALPSMVFKLKQPLNSVSETNKKAQVEIDRKDVSALLLKKFNEGAKEHGGPSYKLIRWKSCHLKGWPQGASFESKYWTYSDMLAIYHNIDDITWEPVKDGEETRTVAYTDGTVEVFPFKRSVQHVGVKESSKSKGRSKKMKITNDQSADTDDQKENQLAEEEEELFSDEIVESDTERCKTKSKVLKLKCKQMHWRIKAMAMQQLGLTSFNTVRLDNLDIEGWPRFVGIYSHTWDELALNKLEAALPAMIFKEIRPENNTTADSEKNIRQVDLDRSEMYSLLLKKLNEGSGHRCHKFIPWMTCHINGWPRGVGFIYKNWRIAEMLRVYHHIAGISWEPVQEGETNRRITYTDGTVEYLPLKPARKPRHRKIISDQSDEIDGYVDRDTQTESANEATNLDRLIESEGALVEFGHVTRKRSRDHDPDDSESNKRLKITEDDRSEEADYKYDDIFEDEQQFFDDFFSFINE